MKIKEMFTKDISREISGVIKASETDEKKIKQELEEYVVTKEISKHLKRFYENYAKGVDGETDKMGVWISGFFGSGKSHFLKILSYLLGNEKIDNQNAIDYFEDKVEDEELYEEMERISKIDTETILFNIDSKNPINNRSKEDAILRIFIKVFNEHRNLCSEIPGVADMEEQLINDGVYQQFKDEFMSLRGKDWTSRRNAFLLDRDYVAQAISKVLDISIESANAYVKDGVDNYEVSIEKFARQVKKYIDSKGQNSHLVFLIDEIGQYIGDDNDLILNLQTVTEDLGTYCHGKVWIMVTSQESIDSLLKVKGDDFSKIQGRFDTKLSMTSISADEVIKKRILEKKDNATLLLKDVYREKSSILKNLINFQGSRKDLLGYKDENDFVEVYPFISYQFKLLQGVFEQVRKHGSSGKHLSEGERSMISAFKESALDYADREEGLLVPFHTFYDTIEEFLNPSTSRVIERASKHPDLVDNPMNIELLKLLFMIKYLADEIPSNLENIATLMLIDVDEDKLELKEKIKVCLRKLQSETLIQKNGDEFIFLTDDEQDINREIKDENIEEEVLRREITKQIYSGIYDDPKYKYSKNYSFSFNKKLDDITIGNQTSPIGINILTPLANLFYKSDEELIMKSHNDKEMIIKLVGADNYTEEFTEALRIETYVKKKNISSLPENIQAIITNKQGEARLRKIRAVEELEKAITQASYYVMGEKAEIKGASAREKINSGFSLLINTVFNRISYVKVNTTDESEIIEMLKSNEEELVIDGLEKYDNNLAEDEIFNFISMEEESYQQVRMKTILNRFKDAPYGWNEIDIVRMVAHLLKRQEIQIKYNAEFLEYENTTKVVDVLSKSISVDKAIISKKIKADETLIRTVKGICLDAFGSIQLPEEEDSIVFEIRDKISKQVEDINMYLNQYQGKKYPGKTLLERGLSIFKKITNHKDNVSFFTSIKDSEDEMLDWIDDIVYITDFFQSQKEIFDKGLKTSKRCEENKDYLGDDLLEELGKLNRILCDPMPYDDIREIVDIVTAIEQGFDLIIKDKVQIAKEKIKKDYEYCLLKSKQYGVGKGTAEVIEDFYERQLHDIDEYTDIYRIDASITISTNKKEYFENQINKQIEGHQKELNKEHQDNSIKEPEVEKLKEVKKVTISNLISIKSLKTESDVEVYLKELKDKLVAIIKEDKEIEIE